MNILRKGYDTFKSKTFPQSRDLYRALAKEQRPEGLFISCSDSRVCPHVITNQGPGRLFVIRNAGNIVPAYNLQEPSQEAMSIEFAIKTLPIQNVVVCGHARCGAMQAILRPDTLENLPLTRQRVQNLSSDYREFFTNLEQINVPLSEEEVLNSLVRFNVLKQLENLLTYPFIRQALEKKNINLCGWNFKIGTGEVEEYMVKPHQMDSLNSTKSDFFNQSWTQIGSRNINIYTA